jgi:hypothetical protein
MNHSDPYVFSRGSLKLTYDLLRQQSPSLALVIRNITSLPPMPKLEGDVDNAITDCFLVDLEAVQVRAVVENLTQKIRQGSDVGSNVVAQALLEDWLELAEAMLKSHWHKNE